MEKNKREYEAIEEIKKIVEELGRESHVAAAMNGVLELAEQNIRDDAMYSFKRRAELAEALQATAERKKKETEKLLKESQDNEKKANLLYENANKELERMRQTVYRLKMPKCCQTELIQLAEMQAEECQKYANEYAEKLANAVLGIGTELNPDTETLSRTYRQVRQRMERMNTIKMILSVYD